MAFRTLLALASVSGVASASPPHIVFIVADDLGNGDLGYKGSEIRTPVLDGLVAEGRELQNYYVQPSCSPTRASIHTGRYVMRYKANMAYSPTAARGVPLKETFLPQVLKKEGGYRTHAVGKWHLGAHAWEFTPAFRGYESYLGFLQGGQAYFSHLVPWFGKASSQSYDFRRQTKPDCGKNCSTVELSANDHYTTHLFTSEAIDIIQAHDVTEPLFLYLAYQAVHGPDQAPESYVAPYAHIKDKKRRIYAGMLACLDEGVGNVTAALKARGMWKNTLLVLTADNGGPTDVCMAQGSSNAPLRGGKCSIWEGGTRGEAFVSGGFVAGKAGQAFPDLMHAVDWLPTLASLAGVGADRMGKVTNFALDGVSQAGNLIGDEQEPVRDDIFYGFTGDKRWGVAVRTSKWKLLRGFPYEGVPVPFPTFDTPNHTLSSELTAATADPELRLALSAERDPANLGAAGFPAAIPFPWRFRERLYDLENDAEEQYDLSAQFPQVAHALGLRLDGYVDQAPPKDYDPGLTPQCDDQEDTHPHDGPNGCQTDTPWCDLGAAKLIV